MRVDVKIPEAGESITEGVLITWFKPDGAMVVKDDPLFELETDKITMQVEAEAAGRLAIAVAAGSTVAVGQVVAAIDTEGASAETLPTAAPNRQAKTGSEESRSVVESPATLSTPVRDDAPTSTGPAARRLMAEHGVGRGDIEGSGKGGRVTKGDVIAHLERRDAQPAVPSMKTQTTVPPSSVSAEVGPRETRKPMSSLRRRVAERLVQAQQTAAILTTFNEVDMSAVLALRERYKDAFAQRYGVKLGFMSFFVKAAVDALRAVPVLNGRIDARKIDAQEIVQNHYYDIGVAVGTPRGLVVPVVRDADRLSFAQLELQIAELARRAGNGKLELSELQGGCFTLSNGGIYGSMLSTPILNPPQSGILGMHAIKKRPIVGTADQIVVRPMMYLALSYDHRLVDGREAVTFLKRIVEVIEVPERLMLEI